VVLLVCTLCNADNKSKGFVWMLALNTAIYVEIKCQLNATDVFYCRSYCLLNIFRAPLCPSSGALEYYTVGCRLWSLVLGFQVVGIVWSWGLCVRFAGCCFTAIYIQHNIIYIYISKSLPQQAELAQGVPDRLRPRIFLTFGTTRLVEAESTP
jgi:hypothetical protein